MAIKKPLLKSAKKPTPTPEKKGLKSKRQAAPEPEETEEEEAETEEEPDETPKERRLRLKREAEEEEAEAETETEEEPEAEEAAETPKERRLRLKREAEEEAETEEEPDDEDAPVKRKGSSKKKGKKKQSFADIFDSTKPGRGLFPIGDWKAKVLGYELDGEIADEDEEQGPLKVKVTYEGHEDEEEVAGKKISQWYQLVDDDGDPGPGISFLKGDLDILGYEDVVLADLQDIFDDIDNDQPDVVIKVKENKGYTNAYLQGLADGE